MLTKDSYRPFTVNMVASYDHLWPDHPLEFLIPYQHDFSRPPQMSHSRVTFVQTREEFQPTILNLLSGLHEDSWVFFCIDDKFPTFVDHTFMSKIIDNVLRKGDPHPELVSLAFTRARKCLCWPDISIDQSLCFGEPCYRRAPFANFWFHQLVRVKVLRAYFDTLPPIQSAKEMDGHGATIRLAGGFSVTRQHALSMSESTSRGRITSTALHALGERGIDFDLEFLSQGSADVEPMRPDGVVGRSKVLLHDMLGPGISRFRRKLVAAGAFPQGPSVS